jgi:hypothetical protein
VGPEGGLFFLLEGDGGCATRIIHGCIYRAMLACRRNKPRAVVQVDRLFLARTVLFVRYFLSQSSCEGASNMYYLLDTHNCS